MDEVIAQHLDRLEEIMPDTPTSSNGEVIIVRLEALRCDVQELKSLFKEHITAQAVFEKNYWVEHGRVDDKANEAHRRIDGQEKQLKQLTDDIVSMSKAIQPLLAMNKIWTFIGVTLGASVIALIWGIITHSIQVIIP